MVRGKCLAYLFSGVTWPKSALIIASLSPVERRPLSVATPTYFLPLALKTASREQSSPLAKVVELLPAPAVGAALGAATLVETTTTADEVETSSGIATRLEEAMSVSRVVGAAMGVEALTDGIGAAEVGITAALVAIGAADVSMVALPLGIGAAEGAAEVGAESLAPSTHCE
jgi:hypothetical protein